ncbi:MAG: FtsX-like permease family protein [Acidimicrobiia bacterium]
MLSTFSAAWRNLVKRLAADWLILSAVGITILLAGVLLASGPIYADAVTISALQRSLADAPVVDAYIEIRQDTPPHLYELSDQLLTESIEDIFGEIPTEILHQIDSESFQLVENADGTVDLASFRYLENIESHATLVEGTWPANGSAPHETAVLESTADQLELSVGDRLTLTNRLDESLVADVVVAGIYQVTDPRDPFWFEDELGLFGITQPAAFRTFGPFIVDRETMTQELSRNRFVSGWHIFPDHDQLTVPAVRSIRNGVAALGFNLNLQYTGRVGDNPEARAELFVKSGLADLLGETERSLSVTRSSVLALLAQLAVLAGYALVLAAGLLVEVRRTETILLRSRGASPNQILVISVLEGVLLTLPAALLAPWLAAKLLGALNDVGPLQSIGLNIDVAPNAEAYILAAIAAVGSIVALSWPAYRSAKSFPESSRKNRRQEGRSGAQRAGVDVALLALAVLAFWQLQSLGPQIGATVKGRFGVDPLLVIAPALGLLAGAVLALRMIPLLARMAERLASAGKSTVSALSAWQVARRPVRYARSALLLIMAISIGFFAASFSTTWLQSQEDQAAFQVGADITLTADQRTGRSIPDMYLPTGHETIAGVARSMPVVRRSGQLPLADGLGRFVFVDSSIAAEVINVREDLAPDFHSQMALMTSGRPELAGVDLPGEPTRLRMDFLVNQIVPDEEPNENQPAGDSDPPPVDEPQPPVERLEARLTAVVQDGSGLLHRVRFGSIPVDAGPVAMEAVLSFPLNDETLGSPRYPLSVVDIELLTPSPIETPIEADVHFGGIYIPDPKGGWQRVDTPGDDRTWTVGRSSASIPFQPSITRNQDQTPETISIFINTGASFGSVVPVYFSIRPDGTELPETLPILVTEDFLQSNALSIGDTTRLVGLPPPNDRVEVIGTIGGFPTVDPDSGEVIVIDLPTVQMMGYAIGAPIETADEYWLKTNGGLDASIEATLSGPDFDSVRVVGKESRTKALTSDPVALGTIGALTLGFVAAAVFATVGFAVSATVSARERLTEFALLRALGLAPRQLAAWLSLEQGVLVVLSLALGTLVGAVLTAAILPLVSLTQEGANAVPGVTVIFPWSTVFTLELAVLAVLGAMVIVMTLLLRRLGLGTLLRLGED